MSLVENLRAARAAASLSQEHVAGAVGIPRPALSDIERGQRQVSASELKAFAALFGVTADELLIDRSKTSSDGCEEFQVAVTVFVTAHGVDRIDAQHGAEIAVSRALRSVAVEPGVLETPHSKGSFRVQVHKVMDATTAGLNGYLAVRPTNRAYREGA